MTSESEKEHVSLEYSVRQTIKVQVISICKKFNRSFLAFGVKSIRFCCDCENKSILNISKIGINNDYSNSTGTSFTKFAVSQDCNDRYTYKGYKKTPKECGHACIGSSTVFTYGKTRNRCSSRGCKCYCINGATKEGKCTQYSHSFYDIYRFDGELARMHLEYLILREKQDMIPESGHFRPSYGIFRANGPSKYPFTLICAPGCFSEKGYQTDLSKIACSYLLENLFDLR